MRWYNKKNRHIDMTPRELYKYERAKYKKKIEKNMYAFGLHLVRGEYKARIVLFLAGIAVFVCFGVFGYYLSGFIETAETKQANLIKNLTEQQRIAEYERNIVIPSESVDKAEQVAREIAAIQNKYIIAVLEDIEVVAHIDKELEMSNYLPDLYECVAWINMRDRETLKSIFEGGDFYWVGYADNTLKPYVADSLPVFFVLYDSGYPVQIIEYQYNVKNNVLLYRKDWG